MFPSSRVLRAGTPPTRLNSARKTGYPSHDFVTTYLPKPHDDTMFITVIATIIRISSPVIDVNLSQPTHEKLKERKQYIKTSSLSGNPRGTGKWPLNRGWPLNTALSQISIT